jgi:hypothetical protein
MVEFTMSAFARYPDGSTGDAFAEVSCRTPVACFAAMAVEVARWMPAALHAERGEVPEAIEMILGWRDEAASLMALPLPQGPHDPGALEARAERGEVLRPERRGAVCVARPATEPPVRALPCARRRAGRRVALQLPQSPCGTAEVA